VSLLRPDAGKVDPADGSQVALSFDCTILFFAWYYEPNQRRKVIHWIISRAISKMYHRERAITSRRQTHMDSVNSNFATGNAVLDHHLMHLQLEYLSKLRCIQDESNRLIGEMQRLAIEAASSKKGQRKIKEKKR
jgi:hypothetical protein